MLVNSLTVSIICVSKTDYSFPLYCVADQWNVPSSSHTQSPLKMKYVQLT